jgi:peptide alpha-N-acetyltransferase
MAAFSDLSDKVGLGTPKAGLPGELQYIQYQHSLESQYLPSIRALISKDLSEPYSIYVYRYFLYQWGHLCFMVCHTQYQVLIHDGSF